LPLRNIYFIGTAGSGKSSLVNAFREWMVLQGLDCMTLNLDPGAEAIPYVPDIDIRDWVRLDDVMNEYALGPNGAQIVCSDMIALKTKDLVSVVDTFRSDYLLIDTPGQMELFAFRQSSSVVVEALGRGESFLVFLSDPQLSRTPSGFVSNLLLCAVTHFRFSIPFLNVLSKADMLDEEEIEKVLGWSRDPYSLYDSLGQEQGTPQTVLSIELFKAMENIGMYRELVPVSAETPSGMEDIYNAVQQVFEGGEDLAPD